LESSDPKYTTPFATAVAEVAEGNRPSPDQLEFLDPGYIRITASALSRTPSTT
jgi:hypothetical protein